MEMIKTVSLRKICPSINTAHNAAGRESVFHHLAGASRAVRS
jgi:hypothetical protein